MLYVHWLSCISLIQFPVEYTLPFSLLRNFLSSLRSQYLLQQFFIKIHIYGALDARFYIRNVWEVQVLQFHISVFPISDIRRENKDFWTDLLHVLHDF
jgi:hypothetical protein